MNTITINNNIIKIITRLTNDEFSGDSLSYYPSYPTSILFLSHHLGNYVHPSRNLSRPLSLAYVAPSTAKARATETSGSLEETTSVGANYGWTRSPQGTWRRHKVVTSATREMRDANRIARQSKYKKDLETEANQANICVAKSRLAPHIPILINMMVRTQLLTATAKTKIEHHRPDLLPYKLFDAMTTSITEIYITLTTKVTTTSVKILSDFLLALLTHIIITLNAIESPEASEDLTKEMLTLFSTVYPMYAFVISKIPIKYLRKVINFDTILINRHARTTGMDYFQKIFEKDPYTLPAACIATTAKDLLPLFKAVVQLIIKRLPSICTIYDPEIDPLQWATWQLPHCEFISVHKMPWRKETLRRIKTHINTLRGSPQAQVCHTGLASTAMKRHETEDTVSSHDSPLINNNITNPLPTITITEQMFEDAQRDSEETVTASVHGSEPSQSPALNQDYNDHSPTQEQTQITYDQHYDNSMTHQAYHWQQPTWQQSHWQQSPLTTQLNTRYNPVTGLPIDFAYVENQLWNIHKSMNHIMNVVSDLYNHMYHNPTNHAQ